MASIVEKKEIDNDIVAKKTPPAAKRHFSLYPHGFEQFHHTPAFIPEISFFIAAFSTLESAYISTFRKSLFIETRRFHQKTVAI
ncbi:hypothetical protein [Trichococcus palustris]|uniref:hypothetical protein n=1 Tax=Trichococcus palustris TaxID=140314 RepID=UPI00116044B0|nr:hypothetical protein [Trichococcus palustris]